MSDRTATLLEALASRLHNGMSGGMIFGLKAKDFRQAAQALRGGGEDSGETRRPEHCAGEGVVWPDRMWWFLSILQSMGGKTAADEGPADWVSFFCDDAVPDDTVNRAVKQGFIKIAHDNRCDSSTASLTDRGYAYTKAPPAPVQNLGEPKADLRDEQNPVSAPLSVPEDGGEEVDQLIERIVRDVNEWDDRTSPEEYPLHLLITSEELMELLREFHVELLALSSPNGGEADEFTTDPETGHEIHWREACDIERAKTSFALAQRDEALAEKDRLREALKPFAEIVGRNDDDDGVWATDPDHWKASEHRWGARVLVRHIRAAHAALSPPNDTPPTSDPVSGGEGG